jgi:hypothetical protein
MFIHVLLIILALKTITSSFKRLSLSDNPPEVTPDPEPAEKFVVKYDKATCIDPELPPAGEFAIPAKILMGQVLDELDHKFHSTPKSNHKTNPFNIDEDDFSNVLEVVDEQLSPLKALELIDDTNLSIRCGLTELCHRVVNFGGRKPECILDGLHKLNIIATQMNQNMLKKIAEAKAEGTE